MRRLLFLTACVLALSAGSAHAETPLSVPSGYRLTDYDEIAPGVAHATLVRRSPASVVNVALRRAGSPAELRMVLSNDAVSGPEPRLERTSSMCARVRCLVAVNGDFFADTGEPVGAVVADDRLLRSPNPKHHQLIEAPDGSLSTGQLGWRGSLVPSDLQQLTFTGVNTLRDRDDLVLYTPAQGPTTGTNPYGVELILDVVRPEGAVLLGRTTLVRASELRRGGDTPIPSGGAVVSGHGRGAQLLEDLWSRVQSGAADAEALLRLDATPDARESIGGSPILVRNGRRWFADEPRELYRLRAPRTMAGWTADGDLLLVTVDGRQGGYSVGMTMAEAAGLMIDLGAWEAINLDGGGSTTFVVSGAVVNRPSDRAVDRGDTTSVVSVPRAADRVLGNVERPVAVAVALVDPADSTSAPGVPPASLVVPIGGDGGGSPAIVAGGDGPDESALLLVVLAPALTVSVVRRRASRVPSFAFASPAGTARSARATPTGSR